MKAEIIGERDGYEDIICKYLHREFPNSDNNKKSSLLDVLTDIFIGTKDTRYGSVPQPEVVVNIRNIIRQCIEKGMPIPILVPWGGRKTISGEPLDVAEISGIRQILRLYNCIKKYWWAGATINIRVEDTNAKWLYRGQNNLIEDINIYSQSFSNLVRIMREDINDIIPIRESKKLNGEEDKYFNIASDLSKLIELYIRESDEVPEVHRKDLESFKLLNNIGWKGTIPNEQRDYYRGRYMALYNGTTLDVATKMLADYLAGSKARHDLNIKCNPIIEGIDGYIQINFSHPVPGAPAGIFDSTLYYRTVPFSDARTHIAAWRGKGYLKISGNQIKTKITSWADKELIEQLNQRTIRFSDNGLNVDVRADYLISY